MPLDDQNCNKIEEQQDKERTCETTEEADAVEIRSFRSPYFHFVFSREMGMFGFSNINTKLIVYGLIVLSQIKT